MPDEFVDGALPSGEQAEKDAGSAGRGEHLAAVGHRHPLNLERREGT